MYLPRFNSETDQEVLAALMQQNSFATLVTNDPDNLPFATHLPILLDRSRGEYGTLVAHMARANPQWKHFSNGKEVLVIFQGPHTYLSPSWYKSEFSVPTWNYAVVHAYGRARIVEENTKLKEMMTKLVAIYEEPMPQPWRIDWQDVRNESMLKAIVGFEVEIIRLEGKFKLSQNKPIADQIGVINALSQSNNATDHEIANMMQLRTPDGAGDKA